MWHFGSACVKCEVRRGVCVQKDARDACLCGVWLCLDVCVRYLVVLTGLYLSNPGQPKAPSGARKAK